MACIKISIKGRVQGVGFRYSTLRKAMEIGAKGYVQNEMDGGVTILVSGTQRETRLMEKWVRESSPGHIESITVIDYPDEEWVDFSIHH